VKKQLDEEVEHLSASFTQLVAAQRKFQECLRCVQKQGLAPNGWYCDIGVYPRIFLRKGLCMLMKAMRIDKKDILVPLTNSLYVRGKLASPDKVIVDIGTGFYVEKVVGFFKSIWRTSRVLTNYQDVKSASEFYESKVKELGGNVQSLESIVQDKSQSLRVVEEGRPQIILSSKPAHVARLNYS
jgi:prefoldin subunit 5